jgi:hypothetical protein
VTFYIAGGLIGALAWWIKPAPLNVKMNRRDAEDVEVS